MVEMKSIGKGVATDSYNGSREAISSQQKNDPVKTNPLKDRAAKRSAEIVQISKDGDSVELSKKISDATLSGYSEAQLKNLLQNKKISRQQYDKAIKSKTDAAAIQKESDQMSEK